MLKNKLLIFLILMALAPMDGMCAGNLTPSDLISIKNDLTVCTSFSYCGGFEDGNIMHTGQNFDVIAADKDNSMMGGVTKTTEFYTTRYNNDEIKCIRGQIVSNPNKILHELNQTEHLRFPYVAKCCECSPRMSRFTLWKGKRVLCNDVSSSVASLPANATERRGSGCWSFDCKGGYKLNSAKTGCESIATTPTTTPTLSVSAVPFAPAGTILKIPASAFIECGGISSSQVDFESCIFSKGRTETSGGTPTFTATAVDAVPSFTLSADVLEAFKRSGSLANATLD